MSSNTRVARVPWWEQLVLEAHAKGGLRRSVSAWKTWRAARNASATYGDALVLELIRLGALRVTEHDEQGPSAVVVVKSLPD